MLIFFSGRSAQNDNCEIFFLPRKLMTLTTLFIDVLSERKPQYRKS